MPRPGPVEVDLQTMRHTMIKMSRMLRSWQAALGEMADIADQFAGAVERLMEERRK